MRWVLVADSTRCRIFAQEEESGPLEEIEDLVHPPSRLREGEHLSDRPGRAFDSAGAGRHAMDRSSDVRDEESGKFAHAIAAHIDKARKMNAVDGLVLFVEPRFLGRLREKLSHQSQQLIESEIATNLTRADTDTIFGRLKEALRS
jgi:protein required for attachment to host cells